MRTSASIESVTVEFHDPEVFLGASLDSPKPSERFPAGFVPVTGWVLGRSNRAQSIEIREPGTSPRRIPIDLPREDVVAHFGGLAEARFTGFSGHFRASAAAPTEILVVFENGASALLAKIFARPVEAEEEAPRPAAILMYHRIGVSPSDPWGLAVDPQNFREQMECLAREFAPLSLEEFRRRLDSGALPPGAVSVTFDDGYADNLAAASPILERFEIPATVFLTTGALGGEEEFWWDELDRMFLQPNTLPETLAIAIDGERFGADLGPAASYGAAESARHGIWRYGRRPPSGRQTLYARLWERIQPLDERPRRRVLEALREWSGMPREVRPSHRILRAEEARELAASPLIEIGAHTVTHPALSRLPVEAQRIEIESSASALEELFDRRPRSFAYPYGDLNGETPRLLREAGFREAVTTSGEPAASSADPLRLPRIQVGDWDGDEFAGRLRQLAEGA